MSSKRKPWRGPRKRWRNKKVSKIKDVKNKLKDKTVQGAEDVGEKGAETEVQCDEPVGEQMEVRTNNRGWRNGITRQQSNVASS